MRFSNTIMKLHAETGDTNYQIEIKRDGEKVFADIDGRKYEVEASTPEPNVYLLKHKNKIHEIFVAPQKKVSDQSIVRAGNHELEIELTDPKRLRSTSGNDTHADGVAEIKTAMPGKVVRILVEKGAEVKKGEGIIVVEAMKMQNELKSPKDGIIKDIKIVEGATVAAGDILISIE